MGNGGSKYERILKMAREHGLIRTRDVVAQGIHPEYLRRLCARSDLVRVSRGMYAPAEAGIDVFNALAEACRQVRRGVVCLLSALSFYEMGTQEPPRVWMAIGESAHRPKVTYPPIRFVRFSGAALTEGVEEHPGRGVAVRVYCPAKTVADCFKYRNKIGLDVALEALRNCRRSRRATMDELRHYAEVCRVANVMRPYLESLA